MEPSSAFSLRKRTILSALGAPEEQYSDRSPKGSVDVGIRDLIDLLNGFDGLVTTSSCAGRVSLFVEGSKAESAARARDLDATKAAVDGPSPRAPKGMGGHWLFVTHEPTELVQLDACIASLDQVDCPANAATATAASQDALTSEARSEPLPMPSQYEPGKYSTLPLIRLQFEPMILHIQCASLTHARPILSAAMSAGWRESGISSLPRPAASASGQTNHGFPLAAVRSAGLALGSVVGYVDQTGRNRLLVSREYVGFMAGLLRERFESNRERIGRFEAEVRRLLLPGPGRPLGQKKQKEPRRVNGESTSDTRARRAKRREISEEDELSLYEGLESLEVTNSATN